MGFSPRFHKHNLSDEHAYLSPYLSGLTVVRRCLGGTVERPQRVAVQNMRAGLFNRMLGSQVLCRIRFGIQRVHCGWGRLNCFDSLALARNSVLDPTTPLQAETGPLFRILQSIHSGKLAWKQNMAPSKRTVVCREPGSRSVFR